MYSVVIAAPFQTRFKVVTDSERLVNSLLIKHGGFASCSDCPADLTVTVLKKQGDYEVSFDGQSCMTDRPLGKVVEIMYDNRLYDSGVFALHGGAVEHEGGAYVFAAATTSGKTTLVSYLTSHGFGYMTDDCVLVDRGSFEVHPFCTPIHLRAGGREVLSRLGCLPENCTFLDDPAVTRYVYTPENRVSRPLPLKKIFFITRTQDVNRTLPMTTTEKMTALLKSPITEYKVDRDYLLFLSELSRFPCEQLLYSDMEFVAEVIRNG